jgi:predicted dehydrogenase
MQMMDNRWPDDFWANDPVKGGGNVLSQGVHSCDILRFVAGGNPIEVFAVGGNYYQPTGVVDNVTAVFRFENQVSASWVQGDCSCPSLPSKFFMQLYSENKSITLSDRLTTLTYQETGKAPIVLKGTETGFMEENVAFYQCLKNDTEPGINHIDGLYATLMVLQAFESLKSGKPEPIRSLVEQNSDHMVIAKEK